MSRARPAEAAEGPGGRTGTSRLRRWGLPLLLAAAGVALFTVLRPRKVETAVVEERDVVRTLALVGRVIVPSQASLGAQVSGTVVAVNVQEGDRVRAGEVLVQLDDSEARAALRQAEAALAEADALSNESVAQAEREAQQAERDLERIRAVFAEGGLTRQRLEQAEQRAADAASRLAALRARSDAGEEGADLAAVVRVRLQPDQPLGLQQRDDAGHRGRLDVLPPGEFAGGGLSAAGEGAEDRHLGRAQRFVDPLVLQAPAQPHDGRAEIVHGGGIVAMAEVKHVL